jgi:internalin A
LDLSDNTLELPVPLERLPALTELDLRRAGLEEVPASVCGLASLQKLSLAGNALGALPAELAQLVQLTALDLSSTGLTKLPLGICELTSLQDLNIGSNALGNLPAELAQLTELTSLDLSHVGLTEVPPVICGMASLRSLKLSGNPLPSLPLAFLQLSQLAELHLDGDAGLANVASILGESGVQGVFRYLTDLYDDPTPSFSLKLVLVRPCFLLRSVI